MRRCVAERNHAVAKNATLCGIEQGSDAPEETVIRAARHWLTKAVMAVRQPTISSPPIKSLPALSLGLTLKRATTAIREKVSP
jgi:hypothetical protein